MDQPYESAARRRQAAHLRATHEGVLERMTDPFLTDHDRWVLGQFAAFLEGRAPEPDPRAVPAAPPRPAPMSPLYARVRRATL